MNTFKRLMFTMATVAILVLTGCDMEYPEIELDDEAAVEEFRQYYNNTVLPYFHSGEFGSFKGADGIEIAYGKFEVEDEQGAIVMLHGLNETYTKYAEMIYDLRNAGFSIYIMEHRGHGNSGRILNGSDKEKRKVYIKDFDNYVKDVKTFYDTIVNEKSHDKLFFFAHSVGGCVATLYIQEYPHDFDGAILSSPMYKILTTHPTKIDEKVGYSMVAPLVALGKGEEYAVDNEEPEKIFDLTFEETYEKFKFELLTKSWKRWKVYNEFIDENPHLIAGGPGATWGVTNNFVKLAYEATFKLRKCENAKKIQIPILLFQSGDDWLVGIDGHETLKERATNAPEFELVLFPGVYHESYMERDDIHYEVVERTIDFLQSH
ncbi:MAG: alpha/beta hydrolase [bacterium]|nr:alpha/beta hydrolase [bacterium]